MSALRIAFCVPALSLDATVGGHLTDAACIQQEYLAATLRARGHALTMLAPDGLDAVAYTRDLRKVETAPRTWSRSWWFETARRSAWRLQRLAGMPYLNVFSNWSACDSYLRCLPGHDLVHERNALYRIGAAMACRRLGLPYVLFFDADEILEHDVMGSAPAGLLRRRARHLVRYNLHAADRVICVSAAARTRLVEVWRVDASKIVVFANGVDVNRFRPEVDASRTIRRDLDASGPLIIFVGSFYEWHDIGTLLAAFAGVLRSAPTARLVLVGDGAHRRAMERRAVELGIDGAVRFTGAVAHADIPGLLGTADVAVAPYKDAGRQFWLSPMKLFEYMAAGVPVVATRMGQLEEVVSHGRNGLLVAPDDPQAMAEALLRLLGDPELRSSLARRAREDAVQRHSWSAYGVRLEEVYRDAMADHQDRKTSTGRRSMEVGAAG